MSDTELVLHCVILIRNGGTFNEVSALVNEHKSNLTAPEKFMFLATIYDSINSHGG
jgi:hypothetical protein